VGVPKNRHLQSATIARRLTVPIGCSRPTLSFRVETMPMRTPIIRLMVVATRVGCHRMSNTKPIAVVGMLLPILSAPCVPTTFKATLGLDPKLHVPTYSNEWHRCIPIARPFRTTLRPCVVPAMRPKLPRPRHRPPCPPPPPCPFWIEKRRVQVWERGYHCGFGLVSRYYRALAVFGVGETTYTGLVYLCGSLLVRSKNQKIH